LRLFLGRQQNDLDGRGKTKPEEDQGKLVNRRYTRRGKSEDQESVLTQGEKKGTKKQGASTQRQKTFTICVKGGGKENPKKSGKKRDSERIYVKNKVWRRRRTENLKRKRIRGEGLVNGGRELHKEVFFETEEGGVVQSGGEKTKKQFARTDVLQGNFPQ